MVTPTMPLSEFCGRFEHRHATLMWLLGAGASASAGIPTAWDMIWEFKQKLFVNSGQGSVDLVRDVGDTIVQQLLQSFIDGGSQGPIAGSTMEYAELFERLYPSEVDRRSYIDSKVQGAKPSFGHIALASLMAADAARVVWTTNFDKLVDDACASVFGTTGKLTTAALEAAGVAKSAFHEERWPVQIKMHGDFQSRRLKNTNDELREQDGTVRQLLLDACSRYGLVVVGYSGRDDSVMEALTEAAEGTSAFPAGLYWFVRGHGQQFEAVHQLIDSASNRGVEAFLVEVPSFDEAMRTIVTTIPTLDRDAIDKYGMARARRSAVPVIGGANAFPVLRLNAIEVVEAPRQCRRVQCEIGGYAEIRQAMEEADTHFLFGRNRQGVVAFGRDEDIRNVLSPHGVTAFDILSIDVESMRDHWAEFGLLSDALFSAIARHRSLEAVHTRTQTLLAPANTSDPVWKPLAKIVGTLAGAVSDCPDLKWREGVACRLCKVRKKLFLQLDSKIVFDGITDDNRFVASDFARERTFNRYNKTLNDLIDLWSKLLAGDGTTMQALGIGDGIDASFQLRPTNAYSSRASL